MRKAKGRLTAISGFFAVLAISLVVPRLSYAESPSRVALVVQAGDTTITRCVIFGETEINGYEVLSRSGLAITASYSVLGAAVCAIEGTGCPIESCLTCKAPEYWSYWRFKDGNWSYSQKGASNAMARDGDTEGWAWGKGDPPAVIAYESICQPLPPTATPEPPTATPEPPTATPKPPTATPKPPTATPEPPTATPASAPSPTIGAPPEGWLRLDAGAVRAGECTTLRWGSSNAHSVYLNGNRVTLNGSRQVCPDAGVDLNLRVVGDQGERAYRVTLSLAPATASPTPTPSPTLGGGVQQPGATPTASVTALPAATPLPSATASRASATPASTTPASTAPASATPASATPAQQVRAATSSPVSPALSAVAPSPSSIASATTAPAATAGSDAKRALLSAGRLALGILAGYLLLKLIRAKRT